MSETRIDFLYLNEPDMIAAGVTDMARCVDVMEETLVLLRRGDFRPTAPTDVSWRCPPTWACRLRTSRGRPRCTATLYRRGSGRNSTCGMRRTWRDQTCESACPILVIPHVVRLLLVPC